MIEKGKVVTFLELLFISFDIKALYLLRILCEFSLKHFQIWPQHSCTFAHLVLGFHDVMQNIDPVVSTKLFILEQSEAYPDNSSVKFKT